MTWVLVSLGGLLLILLAVILIASRWAYRMAFSVPKVPDEELYRLPDAKPYRPYLAEASRMTDAARSLPCESVWTTADDGVRLHGSFYEVAAGAPVQILFHGYRGIGTRDFSGGLPFALENGYNVLLIDQRAHGQSGGRCLTLGVKERYDCLTWIRYVIERFGADTRVVLYGMSMGAATVLMAAGLPLPENVKGIVADCGYTAPADILKLVMSRMNYPVRLFYPLVRLGARLYGGFDPNAASAADAMTRCAVPVCLIHGEKDDFVPCDMSRENFRLCAADNKRLLTVPNAWHGISYLVDRERYTKVVKEFLASIL
ncbi:MAG: alpha/beta hydrolase [Clostridia bacterium]|nr:alpha/beta hydrolase [Clostridia bacterium]